MYRRQGVPPQSHQGSFRFPVVQTSGSEDGFVLSKLVKSAIQSKKVRIGLSVWLVGLLLGLVIPGTTVTSEMKTNFDAKIMEASTVAGYEEALNSVIMAQEDVYNEKEWFWRFRPQAYQRVQEKQRLLDTAESKLNSINAERDAIVTQAKHDIGLFSEYGLEEARQKFWDSFESGKVFAKRQTFWDTIFRLMSSRDENVVGFILQWIFGACLNFTLGLLGSLFFYCFSLMSMIWTYQPDPFSAVMFYFLALLAAASIVAAYLIGIYGLAAGGVYVVGKAVYREAIKAQERRHHLDHSKTH